VVLEGRRFDHAGVTYSTVRIFVLNGWDEKDRFEHRQPPSPPAAVSQSLAEGGPACRLETLQGTLPGLATWLAIRPPGGPGPVGLPGQRMTTVSTGPGLLAPLLVGRTGRSPPPIVFLATGPFAAAERRADSSYPEFRHRIRAVALPAGPPRMVSPTLTDNGQSQKQVKVGQRFVAMTETADQGSVRRADVWPARWPSSYEVGRGQDPRGKRAHPHLDGQESHWHDKLRRRLGATSGYRFIHVPRTVGLS